MSLFLSTIITKINNTNEKFVIDSVHIMPKDIIKYLDKEKWDIFFVAYPNVLPKLKFNYIREYDSKNSWTIHFNDEDMLELIRGLIKTSKTKKQCDEHDINFIDASKNFVNQ